MPSTNPPTVTVVIPTRNRGNIISNALNSIRDQTYSHFEVIIMDDGSDIENRALYKALTTNYDERFKLHLSSYPTACGLGVSITRNLGIEIAAGKYIAFCDDDDEWNDSDYLKDAVTAFDSTGYHLLIGNQITKRSGQVVSTDWMPSVTSVAKLKGVPVTSNVCYLDRDSLLKRPAYAHLNFTIAESSLVRNIEGFWEHLRFAEDVDFFVRLADRCDKILYRARPNAIHNAPSSRQSGSVSNSIGLIEQRTIESGAYTHLFSVCNSTAALKYARDGANCNDKILTDYLMKEGNLAGASLFARRALASKFTWKWAGYTLYLTVKSKIQ